MMDAIIWSALTLSLATSIGMVWIFNRLCEGYIITGDEYNYVELMVAITILVLVVIAWVIFTVRKVRE